MNGFWASCPHPAEKKTLGGSLEVRHGPPHRAYGAWCDRAALLPGRTGVGLWGGPRKGFATELPPKPTTLTRPSPTKADRTKSAVHLRTLRTFRTLRTLRTLRALRTLRTLVLPRAARGPAQAPSTPVPNQGAPGLWRKERSGLRGDLGCPGKIYPQGHPKNLHNEPKTSHTKPKPSISCSQAFVSSGSHPAWQEKMGCCQPHAGAIFSSRTAITANSLGVDHPTCGRHARACRCTVL